MGSHENQLEFFDASPSAAPQPRAAIPGRFLMQLRHDQAVLCGMAGLLGITIVFACGVERGKHLVRTERLLLTRQEPLPASADRADARSTPLATPAAPAAEMPGAPAKLSPMPTPASIPAKLKLKTRYVDADGAPGAGARGRYAVQVVSFKQPRRAQQEMQQLQGRGERAFLVMRNGVTVVYVGPFPTKAHARDKSVSLKPRYEDCFVRTL